MDTFTLVICMKYIKKICVLILENMILKNHQQKQTPDASDARSLTFGCLHQVVLLTGANAVVHEVIGRSFWEVGWAWGGVGAKRKQEEKRKT